MQSAVEISGLTKIINSNIILDNISLTIPQGAICGIIGKNGSGKSMLFKCISNLIIHDKGTIKVMGHTIDHNFINNNVMGVLIERPGFVPFYNSVKNLSLLASLHIPIVSEDEIIAILESVGLNASDSKPIKKYSSGMIQRLGIAAACLGFPKVIILDEPTNNIDREGSKEILNLIKHLNQSMNCTFLLSSHNDMEIKEICSMTVELEKGKIL